MQIKHFAFDIHTSSLENLRIAQNLLILIHKQIHANAHAMRNSRKVCLN